jgi:hypothetical protein
MDLSKKRHVFIEVIIMGSCTWLSLVEKFNYHIVWLIPFLIGFFLIVKNKKDIDRNTDNYLIDRRIEKYNHQMGHLWSPKKEQTYFSDKDFLGVKAIEWGWILIMSAIPYFAFCLIRIFFYLI